MNYDPKTHKYPYPESTDAHYITIKKDDGTIFDENYPYIDKSFKHCFKQAIVRLGLNCLVFPVAKIRMGLKITGRQKLKEHKDEFANGVITCSNHVHFWDYIMLMMAVRPKKPNVLVWAPNVRGESGGLVRAVGGVPIPDKGPHATAACLKSVREEIKKGGILQIYPEGSMWEFYAPIRPFKSGVARLACQWNKPVLPMAFSYRKPGFVRSKIFHQLACFNLNIGEPLYPSDDPSLTKKDRETELLIRLHEEVCRLAGFEKGENIYEPVFNDSKKIEYY